MRRFGGLLLLAALAICSLRATAAAPAGVLAVAAEGTQFRVTLADGRILRSQDLVGAALIVSSASGPVKLRIAALERDPTAATDDVWLHTLLVEAPDGTSHNLCEPGPDGRVQAFPLANHVAADGGTENTTPEQFELVCTGGVRGKCVRFGYRPWVSEEERLYNACTRMTRADYCGLGEGTTRDGMEIDYYDSRGIQQSDNNPALSFEAGWTERGAVCVNHPRVSDNVSLERLGAACPRLAGHLGDGCTEMAARAAGAILFNQSRR